MSDRLAEIEARLSAAREDVQNRPYSHPIAIGWYAQDVLALVEVTKAARDIESRVVSGPDWNMGEVFNSAGRLRVALSALDGEEGTA